MTPERYRRINQIADDALELAGERRGEYLEQSCGSDRELRSEVDRLLAAHAEGEDFLAEPAVARLAEALLNPLDRPDLAGRLIGRYRMQSVIGVGGHGEVWLAEDIQLGRQVAIKLLSPMSAGSSDRTANLYQEARMSSSLNHPSIVTIYDTGELEGIGFIAQEFVAGETLRAVISRGSMKLPEALRVLVQNAAALKAAHSAGLIHRDIKPENVIIRQDGLVKVLDFGLAGFVREEVRPSESTRTPRVIMGTLKYMAPEQIRGGPVDARTDLFSLGVVLYEMLSGESTFDGPRTAETLHRLTEVNLTPFSRRVRGLPRGIDRLAARLLEKDPGRRYQSAAAVKRDLSRLLESVNSSRRRWLAASSVVACVMLGLAIYRATVSEPSRLDQIQFRLVTPPGVASDAAISPDGSTLAYVLQGTDGSSISLHRGGSADRQLLAPARANRRDLTFAPDGRSLYYVEGPADWTGTLYRVGLQGSSPVPLLDQVTGRFALAPDGRHFAFIRLDTAHWLESLIVADCEGHEQRVAATRHRPQYYSRRGLAWSPDGKSVATLAGNAPSYTARAFRLVEVDLATGAERNITDDRWAQPGSVAWSGDGRTVLLDAGEHSDDQLQLWRVSYPSGRVQRVTNDISDYQRVTQTADSRTVLAVRSVRQADLWVAPAGNPTAAVRVSAGDLHNLNSAAIALDGRLFFSASSGDSRDVWTMAADGTDRRQVTSGESSKDEVAVSSNGLILAYQSDGRIWRVNADGSGGRQLTSGPLDVHPAFSPDGNWIVYTSFAGWSPGIGGQPALWRVPAGGGPAEQLTHDANSMAEVSADGKWIAAAYYRYDRPQQAAAVAIYPFAGGPAARVIERPAGADSSVFWSARGTALEYVRSEQGVGNIWRQSIDGGAPAPLTNFRTDRLFFFHPSADRKLLVLARGKDVHELVLIRGIQ